MQRFARSTLINRAANPTLVSKGKGAAATASTAAVCSFAVRWCATSNSTTTTTTNKAEGSASASSASSSSSTTATNTASSSQQQAYDHGKLLKRYEKWLLDQRVDLSKVDVTRMNEKSGRGLFAKQRILAGEIIVSVPMHNLSISSNSLSMYSPTVKKLEPPQLDAVKRAMLVRGMRDPVLFNLMHAAMCVAAERSNPNSFFTPYFDVLPHPAIPDADVMRLYKDILSAPDILEWGEQRQAFGIVCQKLCDAWGKHKCPPPVLVDWAWRTVLARQHMLPDRGLTPQSVGNSHLNYSAFNTINTLDEMTIKGKVKCMVRTFSSKLPAALRLTTNDDDGAAGGGEKYRLMPTLMPVLDQVGHIPLSNCAVEVCPREVNGSCAELQAIRDIQPGDEIGMSFSRAHTAAFTLYRFGFLPV